MNETKPVWRKSCHANGQCAEVAAILGAVAVRDSKHPGLGRLDLTARQFGGLLRGLRVAQ